MLPDPKVPPSCYTHWSSDWVGKCCQTLQCHLLVTQTGVVTGLVARPCAVVREDVERQQIQVVLSVRDKVVDHLESFLSVGRATHEDQVGLLRHHAGRPAICGLHILLKCM